MVHLKSIGTGPNNKGSGRVYTAPRVDTGLSDVSTGKEPNTGDDKFADIRGSGSKTEGAFGKDHSSPHDLENVRYRKDADEGETSEEIRNKSADKRAWDGADQAPKPSNARGDTGHKREE